MNGDQNDDLVLDGGVGNDSLTGGQGIDKLVGGIGTDTMDGASQNDTFIWRAEDLGTGVDQINGFASGDILQVGDLVTGYVDGVSTESDFAQAIANGTNILVQVDTNGGGDSWTTVAQVNLSPTPANITTVTNALDLTTYTRTNEMG